MESGGGWLVWFLGWTKGTKSHYRWTNGSLNGDDGEGGDEEVVSGQLVLKKNTV